MLRNRVFVLRASCSQMDTMVLANVNVFNCNGSRLDWGTGIRTRFGSQVSNVKMDGCELLMQFSQMGIDTAFATVHNVEVLNTQAEYILDIASWEPIALMDGIHVHNTRKLNESATFDFMTDEEDGHVLRNLDFHDNVHGDSTAADFEYPTAMIALQHCDLIGAHIHDNRVIIPGDPEIGQTQGHWTESGAFVNIEGGDRRVENVVFENNRVEDLDNYSNHWPQRAPVSNYGRELFASGDTLRVMNIIARLSRQPNHCPELYVESAIELSNPGSTLSLSGSRLEVENLLLEDCDDGGIYMWADTLLMDHVVIRNVGRMGLGFADHYMPEARTYYRFRNVWIENADAADNWLAPQWQSLSKQSALFVGVVDRGPGWPYVYPLFDLQNVTITGCGNMRHLFNFYEPATLQMRNCLLYNNTYDQMVEWDNPITQDWSYNLVEEAVPGEGNLIGLDPLFDAELGVPFLSPQSPCVDAGNPDPIWNDIEDPANPGLARWPSQGGLRNDIGFTGGPHAALLDTNWVAVPAWEPRLRPRDFSLGAPWPNPFNPSTRIPFMLTRTARMHLSVHNLLGQEVAVLVDGPRPAGRQAALFDARGLASGLYLVTLEVGGRDETRAISLVR